MAAPAVPGHRFHRRRRFRPELIRHGQGRGTLMRHFLRPKAVQSHSGPITLLTFGVGVTTAQTVLIAITGGPDRAAACQVGTSRGAVALATVAVAANEYGGAAAGAQIASSREVHGSPWPMGKDGDARFVTYTLHAASLRRSCGRGIGAGLAVGPDAVPVFPPADQISTASATLTPPLANGPEHVPGHRTPPPASIVADRSLLIPDALRLSDDGLRCNPSAGSPAGSKPHNRFSHA